MFKPGDAQGCRQPPKAGDGRGVKSPAVLAEGAHASGTLISDVRPPEPRENKCVFSRPPQPPSVVICCRRRRKRTPPEAVQSCPPADVQISFARTVLGVLWAHGPRLGHLCGVLASALCLLLPRQLRGPGGTSVTDLILRREKQRLGLRSGFSENVTPGVPRPPRHGRPGQVALPCFPAPLSRSAPWQYSGLSCMTGAEIPSPSPHRHPLLP